MKSICISIFCALLSVTAGFAQIGGAAVPTLEEVKATGALRSSYRKQVQRIQPHEAPLANLNVTCAQCHNKIDPPGFALENYDAIGGWRDQYPDKLKVDSSGRLPGGKSFESNAEFRKLVVAQDETFTRCLTKKLLTYAIGRKLNSSDRPSVDEILAGLDRKKRGLRDLIRLVVLSKPFLSN